jgi:hypothetical protein
MWMFVALMTTGLVASYIVSQPDLLRTIVTSQGFFMILIFAQLGVVMGLSFALNKISASLATALFFLYSALTGVTMSVIFVVYTKESIAMTFFITAGTYGAMSVYGYFTKKDLTSLGNMCFMGLIGIIIASVANIFISSSMVSMITAYIGVLVFVGLTAYDTQKIKEMGPMFQSGTDAEKKGAIMGALRLYLDFINLFLMLLRIFGRRR